MMKFFSFLVRLGYINLIMLRYNLYGLLLPARYHLTYLKYCNPWYYWSPSRTMTRGARVRHALVDLGPIFVKIGQIVSTRIDLLPADIISELVQLQDKVPPFSGKLAQEIIAKNLKLPINTVFASLNEHALASASIAQVHAGVLHDGKQVVVKILRPNIGKRIARDLNLLRILAIFAQCCVPKISAFKPQAIVQEVAHTLYAELDLMLEGANAAQLRRNFSDSPYLYIPKIYWEYSCTNMLVMEEITGIPINDLTQLQDAGFNLSKIAERAIDIFFTQVFRDNFFHADLHPGNIFITANPQQDPQYVMVDFGIVGSLSTRDQHYLAANMLALLARDYRRVAELHVLSGWLPANERTDLFEAAIRAVCEPAFSLPLQTLSFAQLLLRLFQTARRFHINIQPQLILLQKSLLSIESLSRNLDPQIELLTTATPYLERWLKKQFGVAVYCKKLKANLPILVDKLPEIAHILLELLSTNKHCKQTAAKTETQKLDVICGAGFGLLLASGVMLCLTPVISCLHLAFLLGVNGLVLMVLRKII